MLPYVSMWYKRGESMAPEPRCEMQTPPLREYQKRAIFETAAAHERYAFYYDTGVGKTRVGAGIIATYPQDGWTVVTPRSVFPAWIAELELWGVPCWTPVKHYHTRQWRGRIASEPNGGVMLVTPQTLALDAHWEQLRTHIEGLIVDESSILCNPKAKITKRLSGWAERCARVYLLSGSPSPQGPLWLWAQASMLGAAPRELQTWWRWANLFGIQITFPGRKGGPWRLRPGADKRILEMMRQKAEYIKKEDVLSLDAAHVFDREFASSRPSPTWERFVREYEKRGNVMLQREIASGFAYVGEDGEAHWGDPARVEAALELVAELDGRNLILWTQFRATKARLLEELPSLGCEVHTDPQEFIAGSGWRVLIAHPRSAGYGTDGLQHVASDMVFVEASFSYDEYYQALSRLHRSGQTKPVVVYRLLAAGNEIEEKMWSAVEQKMGLAQLLQEELRGRLE